MPTRDHWLTGDEIRETMFEADAEIVVHRAREKFPDEKPRIISDNGPPFVAKDFKQFIRLCGMTHVTTSCYYPRSHGKTDRWFGALKRECIRPGPKRRGPCPLHDAPGDRHRLFSVHLGQGVFRCFHPGCQTR